MDLVARASLSPLQNELFRRKLKAIAPGHRWGGESAPDLLYICGLAAVDLLGRYVPLAAPLLAPDRYQGRAWYFTDVVGRPGSDVDQRWAFNESDSFSGWMAVRHGLRLERRPAHDVDWIATGSHLASLEAVKQGAADRAGIDSMILDLDPTLLHGLEVLTSWGPWPAPPVMAKRRLPTKVLGDLRSAFTDATGGSWLTLEPDHLDPIMALAKDEPRAAAE